VAVGVVLLLLFLVRPGATRLKTRIAGSIGRAIGREVEIGAVHLHLLPQPGFDLSNFVVLDDPAFGAEPMLRAQDVSAALRLSSLLYGRLEIARLSLSEPSLNLVRRADGHWNLESLLERTAHTPLGPTARTKAELRPAFPYIEADAGRINFKAGPEKKPFALTGADFALWQESENAWGLRLRARPVRTDFNLTDTGWLSVAGRWQRASDLRDTPLQMTVQWDGAQLGQLTKLLSGRDRGWRGVATLRADLTGTPASLGLRADASVQDFRRYDIPGGESLRLATHCEARYGSTEQSFTGLICQSPVGSGMVKLWGEMGLPGSGRFDLAFSADNVPLHALAQLARHAKKDLAPDLVAAGSLNGRATLRRDGEDGVPQLEGKGEADDLRLVSVTDGTELELARVPLLLTSEAELQQELPRKIRKSNPARLGLPNGPHLEIGPFPVPLGHSRSATMQAWLSRSGYSFWLEGDADVQRLLRAARMAGLPAAQLAADGLARVDLRLAGPWAGFSAPHVTGAAQLHDVRAEVRGLNAPIEISSAALQLAEDEVRVEKLTGSLGHSHWAGSLSLPRGCGTPEACLVRFDLSADDINLGGLSQLLTPHPSQRPWYRLLSPNPPTGPSLLVSLHASGKLSANRVAIHDVVATRVSGQVSLDAGRLRVTDWRGDLLGGKHHGDWSADFTAKPPAYSGSGTLEHFSLSQLSDAMHDNWVTGTANATYHLTSSVPATAELLSTAEGTIQFEMRDGVLPHLILPQTPATPGGLKVQRLAARVRLDKGQLEIEQGKLYAAGTTYQVSGGASVGRKLDVKLLRPSSRGYSITGTLAEPRVAPIASPETEAALQR